MKPFAFRLESVLRVRSSQRDQRRVELADALARLEAIERALADIDQELVRARAERKLAPGPQSVDRLQAADVYEALVRERREAQALLRAAAAEVLAERRAALLAAEREVRSLELLREADLDRFRAEHTRRQTVELDELAGRPFAGS